MIEYKIIFIETDLKEVSQEQVYDGSYQIFFEGKYYDIEEVDDTYYHLFELSLTGKLKSVSKMIKIEKSKVIEIYKPVIELLNPNDNQLLMLNEYVITKKPSVL